MNKEQASQDRPPLTLAQVEQMAQEVLLQYGQHLATLLVEGSTKTFVGQIENMPPSFEERQIMMFQLGIVLAEQEEVGVLHQVFFITEAWMSTVDKDGNIPTLRPSEDPNRKEILIITHTDVRNQTSQFSAHEMVRDESGTLRELQPHTTQEQLLTHESPLLDAFLIGFLGEPRTTDD